METALALALFQPKGHNFCPSPLLRSSRRSELRLDVPPCPYFVPPVLVVWRSPQLSVFLRTQVAVSLTLWKMYVHMLPLDPLKKRDFVFCTLSLCPVSEIVFRLDIPRDQLSYFYRYIQADYLPQIQVLATNTLEVLGRILPVSWLVQC